MRDRVLRFERAARARTRLSDAEWWQKMQDHRWAIGQLTRRDLASEERARLNSAVLATHARLHARDHARRDDRLGRGLRRLARPFIGCWLVFAASAVLAAAAVAAEPTTVYSLVPRALLSQIAENAWGVRSGRGADVGMTLFYSVNNSRACFMALGLGVLGVLPGLVVVGYNGALLGAVAGHALHLGVFGGLVRWLGPHGVPELTAVMLSGAIGWTLGLAWMRPGCERRRDSLAAEAHRQTPWIGVAVLLILVAAPLEGFVSPLPLPLYLDAAIASGWIVLLASLTYRVFSRRRAAPENSS